MLDTQMVQQANKLLETSHSFLLSTNDRNGFPNTIVVSKPILRVSFHQLHFYVDGEGQTAENIQRNNKGNICCYDESGYESLLLKGIFSCTSITAFPLIEARLTEYQKQLTHVNPVILSFETYTVTVHAKVKTIQRTFNEK